MKAGDGLSRSMTEVDRVLIGEYVSDSGDPGVEPYVFQYSGCSDGSVL